MNLFEKSQITLIKINDHYDVINDMFAIVDNFSDVDQVGIGVSNCDDVNWKRNQNFFHSWMMVEVSRHIHPNVEVSCEKGEKIVKSWLQRRDKSSRFVVELDELFIVKQQSRTEKMRMLSDQITRLVEEETKSVCVLEFYAITEI